MATLPIDVKGVLEEALNLKEASSTPISVSVFLDDKAPEDLVAVVRSAFASAATHARITISYLGTAQAVVAPGDDLSVIVAGLNKGVGELASRLRDAGVPTMVVTSMPDYVNALAHNLGYPIPVGDVVAPLPVSRKDSPAGKFVAQLEERVVGAADKEAPSEAVVVEPDEILDVEDVAQPEAAEVPESDMPDASEVPDEATALVEGMIQETQQGRGMGKLFGSLVSRAQAKGVQLRDRAASAVAAAQSSTDYENSVESQISAAMPAGSEEPYPMTEENKDLLNKRMGEWIIATCGDKKLAFALAFPFVRKPLALEAVNVTSVQNGGIGAVLFIPGADMPIMTMNQAKMLLQIAAAYGQPMTASRAKELAAVVAGAFACRTTARQLVGLVPAAGFAIKAVIGYTGTLAMGRAAIEYFEDGGGAAGLAGVVGKVTSTAGDLISNAQATPDEQPQEELTTSQKAANTAKGIQQRLGQVASGLANAAKPAASALAQTSLESFAAGASSVASSVKKGLGRK
ncbi:MAG: hypothetical protein Q4E12_01485 [Coriobacteriia bacterium]|nr:hypothetical protein [Coriobacteriia bacterium]